MENTTTNTKPTSIECTINGIPETIRFSPFTMESERSPYTVEQEYGLDRDGNFSTSFVPFEDGTIEKLLMDFVQDGDIQALTDAGIILCERPEAGNISRNIALFDPKSGFSYTVGGIGLIKPTKDPIHFILSDPLFDEEYGAYQKKRKNPVGGTQWFTEEGMTGTINTSIVGTLEYNSGPYHAVRKALENEKLKEKGLNCPQFIAAGPITSIADSKFGFTIYRSNLTPEYFLNLGLYIDQRGNLKQNYFTYLESKYSQLFKLHNELNESHGQPSITNTLTEIGIFESENNLACQIKDFETNQPIPVNKKRVILDGLSPTPTGWVCKKSPHAAAQLYDVQLSVLQEFNVIHFIKDQIKNPQDKFNFIQNQCARILFAVSKVYPISTENECKAAIEFAMKCFLEHLQRTGDFSQYNYVISGAFAHKWFANSKRFGKQVEIIKSKEPLPKSLVF